MTSRPEPVTPDALVIGAGPAGLMAADMISAQGHRVVIAEAMPSPARKFLMAGKSGLNISRDQPLAEFAGSYFEGGDWLGPMLEDFGPARIREWMDDLGIAHFVGSTGRIFPRGMKASPLLRSWLRRLADRDVDLRTRWRWLDWAGDGFLFETPDGDMELRPRVTVLALGGASWARLGSDGSWAGQFRRRGIALSPFKPSNVGFRVDWSAHMARFFGKPVKPVRMSAGEVSIEAEFVVTRHGLEGGGIYGLSDRLRAGVPLELDLLPQWDVAQVVARLGRDRGKRSLSNHLRKSVGISPVKIALLREFAAGALSDVDEMAGALKQLRPEIVGPFEMDQAISTGGGVARTAVDADLMLRDAPGVFCAGEMLDWDAPTGGYLLTACLATGRHAGLAAARRIGSAG